MKDLARRRTVIVIGSGVSRHSVGADGSTRPPLWKEFLRDAVDEVQVGTDCSHIAAAIDQGDLLHACEWLKKRFDEDWNPYLRRRFVDPQFSPAQIHRQIALLDSRIVFSLNFDDIYESISREINETSQFVKIYNDPDVCEFLRGYARYIVKVHGSLASPASLVFTQEEYARARVSNSLFYDAFDAALRSHTFLFIGCGYGDPDLNLLLENQAFQNDPGTSHPHFFLTSDPISSDLQNSLRRNRNLKTLLYEAVDENHSGLVAAIESLGEAVTEERVELLENRNW
ncbi:SIR2 family protein [Erythrobacter sp. EC-HK427]|uniref:SIR2 family protein n=1 Tax=Erythrobacter sp. EC-HK427 TaxID=2038396 RepID=UPI0018FE3BC9